MERTDIIYEHFKALRSERICRPTNLSDFDDSHRVVDLLKQHPLFSAVGVMVAAVWKAIGSSGVAVEATLYALDTNPATTNRWERSLLLAEATLLSASTSLKGFVETVTTMLQSFHEGEPAAFNDSLLRLLGAQFSKERSSASCCDALSEQLLCHFKELLTISEAMISRSRMRVALCKEELCLYKNHMAYYGRCGRLSCADPSISDSSGTLATSRQGGWMELIQSNQASKAKLGKPSQSAFGLVSGVSKQTKYLVGDVVKRATHTIKRVGIHADTAFSIARGGHLDGIDNVCVGTLTATGPKLFRPPDFEYSQEEERRLQEQNVALDQLQSKASAQDARAIEASVRELSQLTSFMNEQVVQQGEQFSILLRNTEATQLNVQRALNEVRKPVNSFWTPTRHLIAVLWLCTLFLIISNWWAR